MHSTYNSTIRELKMLKSSIRETKGLCWSISFMRYSYSLRISIPYAWMVCLMKDLRSVCMLSSYSIRSHRMFDSESYFVGTFRDGIIFFGELWIVENGKYICLGGEVPCMECDGEGVG